MTATREAACSCGQLRLTAEGDPIRISMCHCLACQRRTGSAFGMQARFPADRVRVDGRYSEYVRTSDDGEDRTFRFCPECGATVFYTLETAPDLIAVPIGAFADPTFPQPRVWSTNRAGTRGSPCLRTWNTTIDEGPAAAPGSARSGSPTPLQRENRRKLSARRDFCR
jgi:hypothetical protein